MVKHLDLDGPYPTQLPEGNPFDAIEGERYWSSTTYPSATDGNAYILYLCCEESAGSSPNGWNKGADYVYVWAVRTTYDANVPLPSAGLLMCSGFLVFVVTNNKKQ